MRHKIPAILLLFILAFHIFKPAMPFIQYAIFKDYIAKKLCINKDKPKNCCQGKCFLAKQIKNNTETNTAEKRSSQINPQAKEAKEYLSSHIAIPRLYEIKLPHCIHHERIIVPKITLPIFVPPENLASI